MGQKEPGNEANDAMESSLFVHVVLSVHMSLENEDQDDIASQEDTVRATKPSSDITEVPYHV